MGSKYAVFLTSNGDLKVGETTSKNMVTSEMEEVTAKNSNKIKPDGSMNCLVIEVKASEKKQTINCFLNDKTMKSSFSLSQIEEEKEEKDEKEEKKEKFPFDLGEEFVFFGEEGIKLSKILQILLG